MNSLELIAARLEQNLMALEDATVVLVQAQEDVQKVRRERAKLLGIQIDLRRERYEAKEQ